MCCLEFGAINIATFVKVNAMPNQFSDSSRRLASVVLHVSY